ncbi:MAG: AbrB/MazE/SpoVT family DNA-binding domain-containing protein [Armatimonadota bacterium]
MSDYTGTVGERGQVTIPQALRERFGLRKGTKLDFTITEAGIAIKRQSAEQDPVWRVFGRLNCGVSSDEFIKDLRDE